MAGCSGPAFSLAILPKKTPSSTTRRLVQGSSKSAQRAGDGSSCGWNALNRIRRSKRSAPTAARGEMPIAAAKIGTCPSSSWRAPRRGAGLPPSSVLDRFSSMPNQTRASDLVMRPKVSRSARSKLACGRDRRVRLITFGFSGNSPVAFNRLLERLFRVGPLNLGNVLGA
jgi:hypothetical protein